ncbi:MAG: hypothetical protein NZO16_06810, partial [Deltaproteobacteria bacterium]|nr:hypothetical protein [Deltaproteobacteria bacterium]
VVAYPNRQRDNPVILFTSSYDLNRVEIAEADDRIYLAVTQNGDRGHDAPVKLNISYTLYEEPLVLELERLIDSTSVTKFNPNEANWLRKDIARFKHAHGPIVRLPYPYEQAIFLVARGIARALWELQ